MEGARIHAKKERAANQFLDVTAPEIMEALRNAPMYQKHALVRSRRAQPGERINTVLRNGDVEKKVTAQGDEWVVTNPQGEEYLVPAAEFERKYAPTDSDDVYRSQGFCRALKNPVGAPIEIGTQNETMRGDENSLLVNACDENGNLYGEPYIIAGPAFAATYQRV